MTTLIITSAVLIAILGYVKYIASKYKGTAIRIKFRDDDAQASRMIKVPVKESSPNKRLVVTFGKSKDFGLEEGQLYEFENTDNPSVINPDTLVLMETQNSNGFTGYFIVNNRYADKNLGKVIAFFSSKVTGPKSIIKS